MGYPIKFLQCGSDHMTFGRCGETIDGIAVHFTATTASARNNVIYFSRNERQGASAHYFVDDISEEIYQSVRDCDTAYAVGNWAQNLRTISIEVVSAGEDFSAVEIKKLAWLVQSLMAKYGVKASRVIRHYDVSGKRCPAPYIDQAKWSKLHSIITGASSAPAPSPSPAPPAASHGGSGGDFGGTYVCQADGCRVRTAPSLSAGVVAHYNRGQTVILDNWYKSADGWIWGRYTGAQSGQKRYIAVGKPTGKPEPDDLWIKKGSAPSGSAQAAKPAGIRVGSKVRVTNPYDVNGTHLAVSGVYDIIQVDGNRVVIGRGKAVTAAVPAGNLALA